MSNLRLALGYQNPETEQDVRMIVMLRNEGIEEMFEQFANFLMACSFPEQLVRERLFPWEYESDGEDKTSE